MLEIQYGSRITRSTNDVVDFTVCSRSAWSKTPYLPLELSSYLSQYRRCISGFGRHIAILSVIVAIIWRHFIRARHSRESRSCRWNFDAICCSSGGITTSSFGDHIAISGCPSMLQTLVDTLYELAVVENPRIAVGIVVISVILWEI